MGQDREITEEGRLTPSVYRIDIIKNGQRWTDDVGLTATADTICATAIALVAEASVESRPEPSLSCTAEVLDDQGRFVLKVELSISK